MVTKKQRERYIWLVFLIGSILLWKVIIPGQIQTDPNAGVAGPVFLPTILAVTILIISGLSFISTFINIGGGQADKEESKNPDDKGKPLVGIIVFAITLGYTFLMEYIHFTFASIICMFLIMWVLSVRKWYLYLVMVALIFLLKFIFEDIMYINLP
ncbi:tripartite tricarboxylate transporter TctB family protein [Oceanobacillus jeddahense]|uniref:tripartite tricarboxylate transporter TctB family protein n=1 Tax=Oceanobacillus jeddahense TaxID=1462527 RepID=UPI000596085B|nr:tripartite tricarboxylate transporter TctB family protein [Oceanobacillus jeddahense]